MRVFISTLLPLFPQRVRPLLSYPFLPFPFPLALQFDFKEQPAANQAIRGSHHGVCREGRPVYYETVGRNDMVMVRERC